jgi:ketosteroid isomerase-like protein
MSEAVQVVRRLFDAVMAGDLAGVMACIDDDVVVIEPESLAFGGVHRGAAAFRDNVLGAILGKMQLKVEAIELIGAGSKVAASMQLTYTSHRSGNSLKMPYVELYAITAAGKIASIDVYPKDTQSLVAFWSAN